MLGFILWWRQKQKYHKIFEQQIKSISKLIEKCGTLDSKMRSNAIRYGQKFEQLIPIASKFPYNLKDVRFLGSPIDMVIFDGLDDGSVREVVFVEVKTGSSSMTTRERMIRDCIKDKRVKWVEMRDE